MPTASRRTLVAALANPSATDGKRSLRRVALEPELLGLVGVAVANLGSVPSHRTGAITELGIDAGGWLAARGSLGACLESGDGLLLADGATSPSGEARLQFHKQIATESPAKDLPTWHVGDGPRHPSRWQRWTYRAHPDVPFAEALRDNLAPVQVNYVWSATRFERASRGDETPLGRAGSEAQRVEKIDVQAQVD